MSTLLRILETDLYHSRAGIDPIPLLVELPARPTFVPALVSNSVGDFLVSRKLTANSGIRVGVFSYEPDRLDSVIPDIINSAYKLSKSEKYQNIFIGKDSASRAFSYISKSSKTPAQPHCCLIPQDWGMARTRKYFKSEVDRTYKKYCKIIWTGVPFPVFCSKPDFLGMCTQFVGNRVSILIHNVKSGLAMCPSP
jgi:hypothetical protein